MLEVNIPEIVAEVQKAFERYENALIKNDVSVLIELFWNNPHTIRYGAAENLYGIEEISAFRKNRPSVGLERRLLKTVITTFGRDFATANTEFEREHASHSGRQSQTWVRTDTGWRIVAAHVSLVLLGSGRAS